MNLLVGFLSNKEKDLFTVRLGTRLLLLKYGVDGFWADAIGWVIRSTIGLGLSIGVYLIDLTSDALLEGMKIEEFKKIAEEEYKKAAAKVYTEAEKDAIRQEFLDTLDRYTDLGGVPDNP